MATQSRQAGNISASPAHETLQEEMQFYQMLNDAGIDRVIVLDTSLRIICWNRMCEEVTGLTKENVAGRRFDEVFPSSSGYTAVGEALKQALLGRRSFVSAEKGAYEHGHYERHFMPLKDESGTVQGVLNIIHDVAHRVKTENQLKMLNRELKQKLRELERANAELATFTQVTSHDLKEPLRKIYTFLEMLSINEAPRFSDTGRANLRRVQSAVQRLGLLTDDLVSFSEASASDEPSECLDLTDVLSDAMMALHKPITELGALIESDDNLPRLSGPKRQYVLLFQHLLSNALKFQVQGNVPHVRITAQQLPGEDAGHPDAVADTIYHCICFADNGIGIEEQYFERIFSLFQRLHGKGEYPGTGIGLAICKKVAERHGGFITVSSELGKGSRFCCWLPIEGPDT